MNKKLIRMIPVASAILFFSSMHLDASGKFSFGNSDTYAKKDTDFTQIVNSDKQVMYLSADANILQDESNVSSTIETDAKGTQVQLMSANGEMCQVVTPSGKVGYVHVSKLTTHAEDIFNTIEETKYANGDIEVKQLPQAESTTITTLALDDEVKLIGTNDYAYYKVDVDGVTGYVLKEDVKDEPTPKQAFSAIWATSGSTGTLTKQMGVNYFGGRRETYYSSNVLYHYLTPTWTLDSEGFYRDGSYYVVAASDMPKGTTFACSKGMCKVLDTGCPAGTTDYYVAW